MPENSKELPYHIKITIEPSLESSIYTMPQNSRKNGIQARKLKMMANILLDIMPKK